MAYKLFVGIDNGVSGTIGILGEKHKDFVLTPVIREQNYTKSKDIISRIDFKAFQSLLRNEMELNEVSPEEVLVVMERPLVNPTLFKATCSALRSFESELCVVESLEIPHMFCDSKEWQKVLLPHNLKGSAEQKMASKDVGCRLFPQFKDLITKHHDADGLLIAEWARCKFN